MFHIIDALSMEVILKLTEGGNKNKAKRSFSEELKYNSLI